MNVYERMKKLAANCLTENEVKLLFEGFKLGVYEFASWRDGTLVVGVMEQPYKEFLEKVEAVEDAMRENVKVHPPF